MKVITVINAKGGCGKSTLAVNIACAFGRDGKRVLLADLDPQAQLTEWLDAGDGVSWQGSILAALMGRETMTDIIQETAFENVSFIPSAEGLEAFGRKLERKSRYEAAFARTLVDVADDYDYLVIDSPNQISPIMRNAIFPADVFVVPFESTKAVKSYANVYKLIRELRPEGDYERVHVPNNLPTAGVRKLVIQRMRDNEIPISRTEVRHCGWTARVDEHGGSIFAYRPKSKGAQDHLALKNEIVATLNKLDRRLKKAA